MVEDKFLDLPFESSDGSGSSGIVCYSTSANTYSRVTESFK